jgi:hypothetical protein
VVRTVVGFVGTTVLLADEHGSVITPDFIRPEYDPQSHSMAAREAAKAAELRHDGDSVSAFTVRRKRQRYETRGLAGLVDGRSTRARPPHGRTDSRVAEALRRVIDASTDSASRTVEFFRWKVEQQLTAAHGLGEVTMPSRAAFYRLRSVGEEQRHDHEFTGAASAAGAGSEDDGGRAPNSAVRATNATGTSSHHERIRSCRGRHRGWNLSVNR